MEKSPINNYIEFPNFRIIFIPILICLSCLVHIQPLYAANIYLTDGRIITGKPIHLSDGKLFLSNEEQHFSVDMRYINALMIKPFGEEYPPIRITFTNGQTQDAHLVLLGRSELLYCTSGNVESLFNISLSRIKSITAAKAESIPLNQYLPLEVHDISDILAATEAVIDDSSIQDNLSLLGIESTDFYDKYWLRMGGHISKTVGNLLWNLIDLYTEKEKSLAFLYNEMLSNEKEKTEIHLAEISREMQSRIYNLRYEFAKRAYLIVSKV